MSDKVLDAEPLECKKQSHSHVEAHYSADDVAAAVKHFKSNIRETQLWLSTNETDIILEAIDEAFADVVHNSGDTK